MVAHIKSLGFASHQHQQKPITKIKQHLRYIEADREHHRTKPELFSKDADQVHRREFFDKLNTQPKRGVVGHKFVLTLSEDELTKHDTDIKTLVRDTMNRFDLKHNVGLDWVAAVHDDAGHPHAHIVIRGYNDQEKQVGMYPSHIRDLQAFAEQEKQSQYLRTREPEKDWMQELDREREEIPNRTVDRVIQRKQEKEQERQRLEAQQSQTSQAQKQAQERKKEKPRDRGMELE